VPADELLVVDCGDFLDRARPETEGTGGAVNRSLLSAIGYDAVLPGNNEGLTYTFEQLNAFYSGLPIPVVCANFRPLNPGRSVEWLTPSLLIRRAGMNIGLIGLTAPFNDYYSLLGWYADDPIETAEAEVAKIRSQSDIVIVLSHLGLRQDERLAQSVPGIDLILGAHTHHLLETPLQVGGAKLSAAGKFGMYVGHLEMTREVGSERIEVQGGCVPTSGWPLDEEAAKLITRGRETAKRRMSRVVGDLAEPLDWSPDRESPLAVLLAEVVRRKTGAEIGLVNAGQFLGALPAGPVTEETLHALCPSPINCCLMDLTGRELLRAMEESLLPEFAALEIKGFGFRGKVLGTLCYDGLEMDADLSRPPYRRVEEVRIGGEKLDPDREYKVGTLDMFTFGAGYTGLRNGRNVQYVLPEFIRELLGEGLADEQLIRSARVGRIRLRGDRPSET
jgi:2',3'-cyclic-nucleotide 2'-phosphodiesterase (5'-nucleotidase family)